MSNSHEIASNLTTKMLYNGWVADQIGTEKGMADFEKFVQRVLAYELSEVPADFEAEPELQFP